MKAYRNLKDEVLTPDTGSTTIIDSRQMFIYGLSEFSSDLTLFASPVGSYTLNYDLHEQVFMGTGAYVYVMEGTSQKALYTVVLFGDLNGDGMIDESDDAIMANIISGTGDTSKFFVGGPFFTAADLNGDGKIDTADQTILTSRAIDQRGPSYNTAG